MPLCTFAFWTQAGSGHFELVIYGYFFINLFTAYNSGTVKKFMNVYETPPFVKFIYSEKATKFCEIFPLLLSYVVPVKSKGKISQNFVAFSEYMNFRKSMPS